MMEAIPRDYGQGQFDGNHLRQGGHPAAFLCASAEVGKAQARDRLAAAQSAVPGRGVPAKEKDRGKQAAGGPHPIFGGPPPCENHLSSSGQ